MQVEKSHIIANKISFSYHENEIFSDISFDVKKGDYVGIIGPNGSGKTTLIKIILGLLKPSQGTVEVNGSCGYIPQKVTQGVSGFPTTVEEIVRSGKTDRKRLAKEDFKKIEKIMSITGILNHRKKLLSELSGGEKQKTFIARALFKNPDILILDEPSSGIDFQSQEKFYSFLKELNKKGITILLISHDINVIAKEVKKVICFGGKTLCYGLPKNTLTEENIKKIYGRDVKFFQHNH